MSNSRALNPVKTRTDGHNGSKANMILYAILGVLQTDPNVVVKRFEQYMAKAQTLSVTVDTTFNGRSFGKGTLKVAKPGRMSFDVKGQRIDSMFVLNEQEGLEVERTHRVYDLYDSTGKFFIPPSRLSAPVMYGIPPFLLEGSLRGAVPPNTKFKLTPKQTINGIATDLLSANISSGQAKFDAKIWVDTAGRIVKFYRKVVSMEGTTELTYQLSGYQLNPVFNANTFSTKLPLGFSPYTLATAGSAVEAGKPLPMGTYQAADTGKQVSLKSLTQGKNALVLIADPEFPSNPELLKAMKDLVIQVPDSKLVVISNRRDPAMAKQIGVSSALYDPRGSELAKLNLGGAPTLYLLNKRGNVVQAFFGFDGKWEGLPEALKRLKD